MPITTEPPAAPDPVDTGWVKAKWIVDDMPTSSTIRLTFATSGPPTAGDCSGLAGNLTPAFGNPSFVGNLSAQAILTELEVGYSFGGGVSIVGLADADDPGLIGGGACPLSSAVVVSFHDGDRYRGGKSRIYVPGAPLSAMLSLREWTDDFISALTDGIGTCLVDIAAATFGAFTAVTPAVRHQFSGGAALTPPVFNPIDSFSIQRRICTQRRRLGSEIS